MAEKPVMPDRDFHGLETPRLRLRRFRETDLDAFVAYRADPEIARFQSWRDFTRAQGQAFIAEMRGLDPDQPGQWYQIAVADLASDLLLGDVAFCPDAQRPDLAAIGYSLARQAQGKGLAREAVAALLAYLFASRGKTLISASVLPENRASHRLLAALGFRRDPAFDADDDQGYSLSNRRWRGGIG